MHLNPGITEITNKIFIKKNLNCVLCNKPFVGSLTDSFGKEIIYPIVIQCGHSLCHICLQQNFNTLEKIVCVKCGHLQNKSTCNIQYFPVNFYIYGYMTQYEKQKTVCGRLTVTETDIQYTVKEINSKTPEIYNKCEECSLTAECYCRKCNSNFCNTCWDRVHSSAKTLKKHLKSQMPVANNQESEACIFCPQHKNQRLELYCKTCCVDICSQCVILIHQGEGHCLVNLENKSEDLRRAARDAEKTYNLMKYTIEKIQKEIIELDNEDNNFVGGNGTFSNLQSEISEKFAQLHGILQLEEERVLNELLDAKNQWIWALRSLKDQLQQGLKHVSTLLDEYSLKNSHVENYSNFLDSLLNVKNLPCYIVAEKESSSHSVNMEFNMDVVNELRKFCTLSLPARRKYELISRDEISAKDFSTEDKYFEEHIIVDGDESNIVSAPGMSVEGVHSLSITLHKPDVRNSNPISTQSTTNTCGFEEEKTYSVYVTFIINPQHFYIILCQDINKRKLIERKAEEIESSLETPNIVSKDDVYLLCSDHKGKFSRCRVIEICYNGTEDNVEGGTGEQNVRVFCFDYGYQKTVTRDRLKCIPSTLLDEPPLAVKCKIFDCIPKDGKWSFKSIQIMNEILKKAVVTMFVFKICSDGLEVDFSNFYPDNKIGADIVSLRDTLILSDCSNFVYGSKKSLSRYPNIKLPLPGDKVKVMISHVNSPADFYVQIVEKGVSNIETLYENLWNYYNKYPMKGMIYNPSIGMPCAALFTEDNKWYRAKIVAVKGKKKIQVFYVDFGNEELLDRHLVRKLMEDFHKFPPMALHCTLNDVETNERFHSEKCKKEVKHCKIQMMEILRISQPSGKLVVRLQSTEKLKENIITDSSDCRNLFKIPTNFLVIGEKNDTPESKEIDVDCFDNETNSKDQCLDKNWRLPIDVNCKDTLETNILNPITGISIRDKSTEEKTFVTKVQVIRAISPSVLYVTFPELVNQLSVLQTKLNDFYNNSQYKEVVEWIVNSKCAVYCTEKKNWYRAVVLEVLPKNKAKVFLSDVAEDFVVPVSSICPLNESFFKFAICAVRCHLSGIYSASSSWPSVSCEYLLSEIENFNDFYITKKGEIEGTSLPVELWVYKMIPGSALEPSLREWVCLNKLLVDEGLALPIKTNIKWLFPGNVNKQNSNFANDMPEELIIAPVSEWLPANPLRRSSFIAIPTYVDSDAVIYLYDVEDEHKLNFIKETLFYEFDNSNPTYVDHSWRANEPCIVKYHLDSHWYRGKIIEVNDNKTYEVLFIDYGNTETCEPVDLREKIQLADIPTMTHKFKLKGIKSASENKGWSEKEIEFCHKCIVDQKCEVTILANAEGSNEPYVGILKLLEPPIELSSFLVDNLVAQYEESNTI